MTLPVTPFSSGSVAALAVYLQQLATSIAAGWQVNHGPDGSHRVLTWTGDAQTTVGAAGAGTALPATPSGYIPMTIDGVEYVLPFYAKS